MLIDILSLHFVLCCQNPTPPFLGVLLRFGACGALLLSFVVKSLIVDNKASPVNAKPQLSLCLIPIGSREHNLGKMRSFCIIVRLVLLVTVFRHTLREGNYIGCQSFRTMVISYPLWYFVPTFWSFRTQQRWMDGWMD